MDPPDDTSPDERRPREARFELVAETAGLGLWSCDLSLQTVACNAIFRAQHGLAPEGEVTLEQLARHIVEAHGGTIRVRSTLGEGASFIVELPLAGTV